jgi:hypothetical protein
MGVKDNIDSNALAGHPYPFGVDGVWTFVLNRSLTCRSLFVRHVRGLFLFRLRFTAETAVALTE